MRRYIESMKNKPVHHRKRFALLSSLTITLAILGVWSLVNFGTGGVLATKEAETKQAKTVKEIGPLESMYKNVASSFSAIQGGMGDIKDALTSFELNPNKAKNEMGENVLNTYDR